MTRKEFYKAMEKLVAGIKDDQMIMKNRIEELFEKVNPIYDELMGRKGTEEIEQAEEPPREAIRLKDARELLGQWSHHSLDWLIEHGAEGYRKGPKEAYIYIDSIKNIKNIRNRKKGKITLAGAAWRADITYKEAKKKCEEMGIPLIKTKGAIWLSEADSAKLVLQYKI